MNRFGRTRTGTVVLIAALSALTACSADDPPESPDVPTATHSAPASPSSKVDRRMETVQKALNALAAKHPSPTPGQLFSTMTAAGFDADRLEATEAKSPLDNEVPSLMYGIRLKKQCLVGEIREGVATVKPAEPIEDGTRCLVGDVVTPGK